MIERLRNANRGEGGMTLVELLVAMLLMGLVITIVGSILVETMRIQRDTTDINETSNGLQNVYSEIELAVRNSTEIAVKPISGGDMLLVVKRRSTGVSGTTAVCAGWFYDASEQQLRSTVDLASGTPPTVTAWATPSVATTWPLVAEDVTPVGATPLFASPSSGVLNVSMRATTSNPNAPVVISSTARSRPGHGPIGGVSCR